MFNLEDLVFIVVVLLIMDILLNVRNRNRIEILESKNEDVFKKMNIEFEKLENTIEKL